MDQSPAPNPYSASADPFVENLSPHSGREAVFLGVVIGLGFNFGVGSVVGWLFMWYLYMQGFTGRALYIPLYQSPSYLLVAHLIGMLATLCAGYWCARLDKERNLLHATLTGLIINAIVIVHYTMPYDQPYPFWSEVCSFIIPIPGCIVGTLLWRRAV